MMRKFPKLLAVVLAIAIIICPAMCLSSMAATANTYSISYADDAITVNVSAETGLLVALLRLDVLGYTVDEDNIEVVTDPAIDFSANPDYDAEAGTLSLLLAAKEATDVSLVNSATVTVPVAKDDAAAIQYIALTEVQAADAGTADAPESFLAFEGVGEDGLLETPAIADCSHIDEDADNLCDACGEELKAACDHENAISEVTLQPTKDAVGEMTYTCDCGETWTEEIAKPVLADLGFKGALNVSSVVGNELSVSTKKMRAAFGDDATYFIRADYKKYGEGYILADKTSYLTAADRIAGSSSANKDVIIFSDIALYEMTNEFTIVVYVKNAAGVVVGYQDMTSSIAAMALDNAKTFSTNTKLLTALADMCNYGAAAQTYFANMAKGSDICDAVLPTTVFADYMSYASDASKMPDASFYNTDKQQTKIVSTTGFVTSGHNLNIGASNRIQYTVRYDNYDWSDVEIKVYYTDKVYGYKEIVLKQEDLVANGTAGNGQPKYLYYFDDLSIFEFNQTVTMDMYYKGVKEATSIYSIGNFVAANLSDASVNPVLTAMVLFSNSVGIQLGQASMW